MQCFILQCQSQMYFTNSQKILNWKEYLEGALPTFSKCLLLKVQHSKRIILMGLFTQIFSSHILFYRYILFLELSAIT